MSGPWDQYAATTPPPLANVEPDQAADNHGPTVEQVLASGAQSGPWDSYQAPSSGPWENYKPSEATAKSDDGEAYKGLRRGLTETGEALKMLPDVAEAAINKHIAPIFDKDKIKQDALEYQKNIQASQAEFPAAVPSYKDINNLSTAGQYLAGQAGEMAPGLATMAIPGGLAGNLAKEGAEQAAKAAVQTAAEEAIGGLSEAAGNKVADKAAQSFINRATIAGSAAGAASTAIPQDYTAWLNKGVDAPDTAIFAGGVTGGLMAVMPGTVMGKVIGDDLGSQVLGANLMAKVGITSPLIQKVLSHAAVGAAELGTAGATAEGLNILAEHEIGLNPDLYTKENLNRVFEAGASNAIAGAVMGAAAAPFINHAELGSAISKEGSRPANVKPLDLVDTPHTKEFLEAQELKAKTAVTPEQKQAVADDKMNVAIKTGDIKAQVEAGKSHSDDGQLTPAWMDEKQIKRAQDMGLDVEGMQKINPLDQIFAEHLIAEAQDPSKKTFDDYTKAPEGSNPRPLEDVAVKDHNRLQQWSDETLDAKFQRDQVSGNAYQEKHDALTKISDELQAHWKVDADHIRDNGGHAAIKAIEDKAASGKPLTADESRIMKERSDIQDKSKEIINRFTELQNTPIGSKLQRALTGYPDLQQSFLFAHTMGNAFEGLEHTPEGLAKHADVANALNRIAQEVTGNAKLKIWDALQTRFEKDPVRGAQFLNTIYVALNDSTPFARLKETLYHEVWHFLEGNNFITDADRALDRPAGVVDDPHPQHDPPRDVRAPP